MLKPQEPLTKQLAPLIVFLAVIILCTLVISSRHTAKKHAGETGAPVESAQLRMELSPFQYSYSENMLPAEDYREKSPYPRADATLQQATGFCDNGEYDKAEDVLRTALVFHPANLKLLSMLGSVLYLQGKYRDAEMIFRHQAFLRPDDTSAYNNLGAALAKQRKFREAISAAEKGLRMEPASSIAALNLSGIHSMAGNTDKAIEYFKKAYDMLGERILPLSNDPNFDNIRNREDFRQIIDQARSKSQKEPQDTE